MIHVRSRAAVADRWLGRVEFDDEIVDPVPVQRRQHVLDRVNDCAVGADGRPARRIADVADIRLDFGLPVEIDPHKLDPMVHRRRFPCHVDLQTRVNANARE
jgi:hypothetical protein